MKLSIIVYYVSLMLYLDSITIIEAASRKNQIERDALDIIERRDYVIRLEYKLCTVLRMEYWEGNFSWTTALILVPEGKLEGRDPFKDEISLRLNVKNHAEVWNIVLQNRYFTSNISVTVLFGAVLLYKSQHTFPGLHLISVSGVTLHWILFKYGYTGNGNLSVLVYAIDSSQEGRLILKLTSNAVYPY